MDFIDQLSNHAEMLGYVFVFGLLFLYVFSRNPYYCLYFFLIWLPLQTFVLSGMSSIDFFSDQLIAFLSAIKELALVVLLVVLLLNGRLVFKRLTFVDYLLLLNIAYVLLYVFLPDSVLGVQNSLNVKIFGLRSALITLVIFYVGRCMPIDTKKIIKAIHLLFAMSILIVLFGFVEFIFIPREILIGGLIPYNVLKGGDLAAFQSADLSYVVNYSGFEFKRMMSFFLSPLTLAYFLIVPFSVALIILRQKEAANKYVLRNPAIALAFLSAAIILSNTRAVLAASMIIVLFVYSGRHLYKGGVVLFLLALVLYLSPMKQVFMETINLKDPSAEAHLYAYTMGLKEVSDHPLGIGLGQAGPTSVFIKGGGGIYNQQNATVGESLYLTTAMERGLPGLIIFLIFIISIAWMGKRLSKISSDPLSIIIGNSIFVATIIFIVASVTTEHWLGFQTSAIYWWFAGIVARLYANNRKENNPIH